MNRQPRWAGLIAWLTVIPCGTIAVNRYGLSDTWHQTLHACLIEIPGYWAIGYFAHPRPKRRADAAAASSTTELPPPPP